MSQALPPNLINISVADLNRAFSQGLDFTSPESFLTLWKFYAASSTFDDDPVAIRSRNLFWRLLSSPQKAKEIDNFQVAGLWRKCQVTEPFVPVQLPKRFLRPPPLEESGKCSPSLYRSEVGEEEDSGDFGTPLLQAESSGSSRTGKRRSGVSGGPHERDDLSPKTGASAMAGGSTRPGLRRNPSSKARGPTVASSSRGRSKPSLPRRRSSQTRPQLGTAQISPRPTLRSPNQVTTLTPPAPAASETSETLETPPEKLNNVPVRSSEPVFALPLASSWQSVDEASEQPSVASSSGPVPKGSLVDRDFRRNFVDTQRLMSSATNLTPFGRGRKSGSLVRFEEVPEVIGAGKGKERASSPGRENAEASQRHIRSDSQVISDSEDSEGVVMPRVQSNLSKLIKDERKQSGGREPPAVPGSLSREGQSAASRKKDAEILEMGRKAGAPLIPKGRPGSDVADRMRTPSPGATF